MRGPRTLHRVEMQDYFEISESCDNYVRQTARPSTTLIRFHCAIKDETMRLRHWGVESLGK